MTDGIAYKLKENKQVNQAVSGTQKLFSLYLPYNNLDNDLNYKKNQKQPTILFYF